ncbi:hypothetical protein F5Y08DRAFT_344315 [Xylaria arbuscula]|nr:hypothetical protein F5Y08DRAFT_344315 [Xylaria arbuscula]
MSTSVPVRNGNERDGAQAANNNNNNNNDNEDGGDITNNNGDISGNDIQDSQITYNNNSNNNGQISTANGTNSSATNTNNSSGDNNNNNNNNSQTSTANGTNSSAANTNEVGNTNNGATIYYGADDAAAAAATLSQATKTIYAASIVTFVSLALQVFVLATVLAIWLHRRKPLRRLREGLQQEKTSSSSAAAAGRRQQKGIVSGYVQQHPVGYWNLPSSTQLPQHHQQQQQYTEQQHNIGGARSPWQDVPPYSSPVRFTGHDAATSAAVTCQAQTTTVAAVIPPPARASNCVVRSELV